MNNLIEKINKEQIRTDIPEFRVGDTVRPYFRDSDRPYLADWR